MYNKMLKFAGGLLAISDMSLPDSESAYMAKNSRQKIILFETEAAFYELTIGLLEICSLGHCRQILHKSRKVDVYRDIWTSYEDLVFLWHVWEKTRF